MTNQISRQLAQRPTQGPWQEADTSMNQLLQEAPDDLSTRRRFFRPTKQSVTIRLDTDVVAWFKARTEDCGYQTAINRALREYMEERSRA